MTHDLSSIVESENLVAEITLKFKQLGQDLELAKKQSVTKKPHAKQQIVREDLTQTMKLETLVGINSYVDKQFTSKFAPRRYGPYLI